MYREKRTCTRRGGLRLALLFASIVLVLAVAVGGIVAFITTTTNTHPITNTFTPSKVTTAVEETLSGKAKSNVKIKNTGDTSAYIRAAVVITWKNAEGAVYGKAPTAGTDYTISYSTTDWIEGGDGFWYHKSPVNAGATTGVLISNCTCVGNAPDGYFLNVEIVGSGVQSLGVSGDKHIVEKAWSNVSVNSDDTLSVQP